MLYNFCGFIWSPVKKYTQEILESINIQYPVLHFYGYEFHELNIFSDSICHIYTTDDIDQKKVKNVKIKNMVDHPYSYTYFKFYIHEPHFRSKESTGNNISQIVEKIKKQIRNHYKSNISIYVHDIIIHISDNFEQTILIDNIMEKYEKYKINEFINLKYFIKCNIKNNVFNRADMLVRKYSIEQYLKNPNYTFKFYKKMQEMRTNKDGDLYIKKFIELIKSIQETGLSNNYPIKCSSNYILLDGSHRFSFYYMKQKTFVPVQLVRHIPHGDYDLKWFKNHQFDPFEIEIVIKELKILLNYCSFSYNKLH